MDEARAEPLAEGRKSWGCLGTLALLFLVAGFAYWKVRRDYAPRVGAEVGSVAVLDAAGRRHTLAEFRGKVVVVDVWATWCPPCRRSLPEVAKLQSSSDGRWIVLPISVDEGGFRDVSAYQQRSALAFQAYVPADPDALAPFGPIPGIPTTIVVGTDGKLRARWSGYYPGRAEQELEQALRN